MCKAEFAKDLDRSVFPGIQGGPLMHVIAAKAVALKEALSEGFRDYQRQIVANAKRLAGRLVERGFRVVSGGTDNHLFLLDVAAAGLTGKVAEKSLEAAGITVNKNTIPYDPNPPLVASGIRIGTPALTTRNMREPEMDLVGDFIAEVLRAPEDGAVHERVRGQVRELCERFPLYDPLM
jgi:glycine hydroxymethyltransferase